MKKIKAMKNTLAVISLGLFLSLTFAACGQNGSDNLVGTSATDPTGAKQPCGDRPDQWPYQQCE